MKFKLKRINSNLNLLLSIYVIFRSIELEKLLDLEELVLEEVDIFYERSYLELLNPRISDLTVVFLTRGKFHKVFKKGLVNFSAKNCIVLAKKRKGKFTYHFIYNYKDFIDFVNTDKNTIYIVESINLLPVIRHLIDKSKTFYFYQDLFKVLEKSYLKIFFNNILNSLNKISIFPRKKFSISVYDVNIEIIRKKFIEIYNIDFEHICLFSQTIYVGSRDTEEFLVYSDIEKIFYSAVATKSKFKNKIDWLENHTCRILDYLYEKNWIFTKNIKLHPDLISCLFPFEFINLQSRFFNPDELLVGGICFSKVLETKSLHGIINLNSFKHYKDVFGTIRFAKFI